MGSPVVDTTRGLLDTSIVIGLERVPADALPPEPAISALTLAELTAGPHATATGDEEARKRLVQALVAEVRVHGRDHIIPMYRNPADFLATQVRTLDDLVGTAGVEPATSRL